ncbi:patatin-like phospholipase family protein [Arthrobacter sp. BL-252-APC-1A]|uniref:patatin-like phospholipase family protein n=1 Tax=Arthrobacter sp. BL-252-APC-1A TaxID=2606622 RepID=UPI0012B19E60|nr:patatin-like phospholipase family protein [Arthrobacter sp. BL-252-APC-1A]MSS00081.1 patatin-like phospholipase family protein [Arthrobacter sp. BL-252-APC-1A]
MSQTRAIILGGGGVAGIAWEMGVLAALLEEGINLNAADLVVGTSAGSMVGAALRSGLLPQVLAAQLDDAGQAPAAQGTEAPYQDPSGFSSEAFIELTATAGRGDGDEMAARARVGQLARTTPAVMTEGEWVASIRSLLPQREWPDRPFGIAVVDAEDGSFTVLDATSDVELARAVAASCAVPTVWPPVTILGRPYMDGGMRSATNADVAEGYGKVLVLACGPEAPASPFGPSLAQALAKLQQHSQTFLMEADEAALRDFGANPLLRSTRIPASAAGRRQGKEAAAALRDFWLA